MGRSPRILVSLIGTCLMFLAGRATAHPGSGIVVDQQGRVFFQDSAAGAIWMIDPKGKLTKYYDKLGGHWMALDQEGGFARSNLDMVRRITPDGARPALLVADGGAPVAVNRDGNLYYGLVKEGGQVRIGITRISPDGVKSPFAPEMTKRIEDVGITGLAAGPDGLLYVACPNAVLKVKPDGTYATVARPVVVSDCDEERAGDNPSPYLRGLDVDARGSVYAAANGCHCVVKITRDGKVTTVLKSERPWSPTGVAVSGDEVYILEYTHSLQGRDQGWRPRVRKLSAAGRITTVAIPSQ